MMLANVTYSRTDRCYKVSNPQTGEIVEFHRPGADGRRNAYRLAILAQDNAPLQHG